MKTSYVIFEYENKDFVLLATDTTFSGVYHPARFSSQEDLINLFCHELSESVLSHIKYSGFELYYIETTQDILELVELQKTKNDKTSVVNEILYLVSGVKFHLSRISKNFEDKIPLTKTSILH